jgi:signaling intermediate in Toll pathway protein
MEKQINFIIVIFSGVMPDTEMEDMLVNVFGKKGHAVRKYQRMMYWMPKFKNLSPWALPNPVPDDSFELARLALQRIGSVDLQMRIEVYQV